MHDCLLQTRMAALYGVAPAVNLKAGDTTETQSNTTHYPTATVSSKPEEVSSQDPDPVMDEAAASVYNMKQAPITYTVEGLEAEAEKQGHIREQPMKSGEAEEQACIREEQLKAEAAEQAIIREQQVENECKVLLNCQYMIARSVF